MLLIILLLFAGSYAFATPNMAMHHELYIIDSLPVQKDSVHLVQKGETLYGIAVKYGVKVDELKEANKINSSHIETGQLLKLPKSLFQEIEEAVKDTLVSYQDSIYVVQKGDVLSVIASKHKLNTKDLVKWNKLESADKIYLGQKLDLFPSIIQVLDSLKVEKTQSKPIIIKDSVKVLQNDSIQISKTDTLNAEVSNSEQGEKTDVATNHNLAYDFTPSGIKTAINVFVLLLLLAVFIYNINK